MQHQRSIWQCAKTDSRLRSPASLDLSLPLRRRLLLSYVREPRAVIPRGKRRSFGTVPRHSQNQSAPYVLPNPGLAEPSRNPKAVEMRAFVSSGGRLIWFSSAHLQQLPDSCAGNPPAVDWKAACICSWVSTIKWAQIPARRKENDCEVPKADPVSFSILLRCVSDCASGARRPIG